MPVPSSPARSKGARRVWIPIVLTLWALAVGGAMVGVWLYKTTPGQAAGAAPETWPTDAPLERAPGRATILMLAHPKCPCTTASISELAVLMARVGHSSDAYVLFVVPEGVDDGWERSATWEKAAAIPGVKVIADRKGALAARFGAKVSGHTVAYDGEGRLAFAGGITASRGHEGENEGRWQIVARVEKAAAAKGPGNGPTFGCDLFDSEEQ